MFTTGPHYFRARGAALLVLAVPTFFVGGTYIGYRFDTFPVVIKHRANGTFGVQTGDSAFTAYQKLDRQVDLGRLNWVSFKHPVYGGLMGLQEHPGTDELRELASSEEIDAKLPAEHQWIQLKLQSGRVAAIYVCRIPWPYSIGDF